MRHSVYLGKLQLDGIFDRNGQNGDVVVRLVRLRVRLDVGDVEGHFHAANHPAEDGVLVVEPRSRDNGEEELENLRERERQNQLFVLKFNAPGTGYSCLL